jgi:hypothetical protein
LSGAEEEMEARAEGSHLRRGMSVEDDRVNDDDVPPLWRGGDDMIERCECDRYSSRGCDVSRRCRLPGRVVSLLLNLAVPFLLCLRMCVSRDVLCHCT